MSEEISKDMSEKNGKKMSEDTLIEMPDNISKDMLEKNDRKNVKKYVNKNIR